MRALRIASEKVIEVWDKPEPTPKAGEVLLRLHASAICGSDLHVFRKPSANFIETMTTPGHEASGEIVALGPGVDGWSIGERVAVYFRRTCGNCDYCRTGNNHVCGSIRPGYGFAADGSDAEFMAADASTLMRIPDELSYSEASILSCQGGTAYAPLLNLGVSGRDRVVVTGLGPVGLLATLFAVAMGAEVTGIDPVAERRALALEVGATAVIDPVADDVAAALKEVWPSRADKLVETSGASAAHESLPVLVRPLGSAALVGLGNPVFQTPLGALTRWQISLFGSTIYPQAMWNELCDFVVRKQIGLETVVSENLSIAEGGRGFELAEGAATGKIMFHFE